MMDDDQKIIEAWDNRPQWDFDKYGPLRVPLKINYAEHSFSDENPSTNPDLDIVTFREEHGWQDGQRARRVVGRFRETEVVVEVVPNP